VPPSNMGLADVVERSEHDLVEFGSAVGSTHDDGVPDPPGPQPPLGACLLSVARCSDISF
jgi:hypothetical protein